VWALPLDLPPQRSDPDVTVRDAVEATREQERLSWQQARDLRAIEQAQGPPLSGYFLRARDWPICDSQNAGSIEGHRAQRRGRAAGGAVGQRPEATGMPEDSLTSSHGVRF
jgi:hypothetical protein